MSDDYLDVLMEIPAQIERGYALGDDVKVVDEVDKIVFVGMGGSAISGDIMKSYLNIKVPVFVCKSYDLPEFVDHRTLVFVISYSGDTEETISGFNAAFKKGARILVITSGGKLEGLCLKNDLPLIKVPSGMQPRAAIAYLFFPVLNVLSGSGLIPNQDKFVNATIKALKQPDIKEKAQELAEKLVSKVPLIYASEKLAAVAYRWKTQLNENAKIHAFTHVFPELNHNELVGYGNLNASYYVVVLQDEEDSRKIKARMKITKEMINKKHIESTLINITGNNLLTRIFSAIHLGDLTSYFLAKNLDTDPVKVEVIEELKNKLKKL